jgi:hypothetical protein
VVCLGGLGKLGLNALNRDHVFSLSVYDRDSAASSAKAANMVHKGQGKPLAVISLVLVGQDYH